MQRAEEACGSGRLYHSHALGAARRGGHWINTSKLHVPAIVIFAERLPDMIPPPAAPHAPPLETRLPSFLTLASLSVIS